MDLKEQHDKLLAERPPGAEHDTENCQYCTESNDLEGGEMSSTYTEDEMKAALEEAIAKALAPYQEEAALEAIAKAIEDAKAPLVTQVAELQNAVDTATLRAETAEQALEAKNAEIEAAEKAAEEAATLATRREERKDAVKEFAFKDEFITERLDRWVAMSDEDFSALLDDWKAVSAKKEEKKVTPTQLPTATALKATSEDDGDKYAARREVSRLGLRGTDIRTLG